MGKGSIWPPFTFILLLFVFTIPYYIYSTGAAKEACISFIVIFFFLIMAYIKSRVSTVVLPTYDDEEHDEEYRYIDDEYEAYPECDGYESAPDLEYRDFNLQSTYQFLIDYNLEEEMSQIKTSKDSYGSYTTSLKRAQIIHLLDSNNLLHGFIDEVWPMGDTEKGMKRIEFFRDLYLRFTTGTA